MTKKAVLPGLIVVSGPWENQVFGKPTWLTQGPKEREGNQRNGISIADRPEPFFPSPRHELFRPLPVKTQPARPSSNPCKPKLNQPSGGRSNAARGRAHQEVRSPRKHAGSPLRSRTTAEASCSRSSSQPAHTSGVGASTEASPSFQSLWRSPCTASPQRGIADWTLGAWQSAARCQAPREH